MNNLVVLFDFRQPLSWKNILSGGNFFQYISNVRKILALKKGIIYLRPLSFLPFQSIPALIAANKKFGVIQLNFILRLVDTPKIIWRFYPLLDFGIKPIDKSFYVYDCIDYLSDEKEVDKHHREETIVISGMDLVAFNSKPMFEKKLDEYSDIANKSIAVICGCTTELFSKKVKGIPRDMNRIKGKKVILAAVLNYRLDFGLINYIIKDNPEVSFIFVGPIEENVKSKLLALGKYKNFHYLGKKAKGELVKYFKNSDIGIIPYKTSYLFTRYANPMKAYEYLASGLPLISTKIAALKNYPKEVVGVADDKIQFSQMIKKMVGSTSTKRKQMAVKIAEKNSWANKVNSIISEIDRRYEKTR